MFKKKKEDAYKLELETTETMKLLGSTKKSTNKTKNGENLPSLSTISITKVRGIIYFYAQWTLFLSVKYWTKQFSIFKNL